MSIAAMNWAWSRPIRPGLKLVLLALADHADNDGKCWPGIKGVAKKCSLSNRQVIRATSEMEGLGLLRILKREQKGSGISRNIYFLSIREGDKMSLRQGDNLSHTQSVKVTSTTQQGDIHDRAYKGSRTIKETSENNNNSHNNKNTTENMPVEFVLPDWVKQEAWGAFEEMRLQIQKPLTDYARVLLVEKLSMLEAQGHSHVDVLNQSTLHSWQGVFPVRDDETNIRVYVAAKERRARIGAAIDQDTMRAFGGQVG